MSEYEIEPIPGLPGLLPPGETILWQGRPDWRILARTAFHTGWVSVYFGLLTAVALATSGVGIAALATAASGVAAVALLTGLAWLNARATIYTLTNRRIVMRIGVALPKCINLPLARIASLDVRRRGHGAGDLAITPSDQCALGYATLWPHAQPWHLNQPHPMLRGVPDLDQVGVIAARQIRKVQGAGTVTEATVPSQTPPLRAPQGVAA